MAIFVGGYSERGLDADELGRICSVEEMIPKWGGLPSGAAW